MLLAVFLLHCFLDPAGQAAVLSFSLASLCPCHVSWHPEMLEPSMIASHLVHASTNSLPPLWKASLCPAERLLESQQRSLCIQEAQVFKSHKRTWFHFSDANHISTRSHLRAPSRDWQKRRCPATNLVLPVLRETEMHFGSLSLSVALRLQDSYSQTRLETTGLHKICPFSASGPGQSRRLAESRSLRSPAPLRQACAAECGTRHPAASSLACLSWGSAPASAASQSCWTLVEVGLDFPEVF